MIWVLFYTENSVKLVGKHLESPQSPAAAEAWGDSSRGISLADALLVPTHPNHVN